MITYRELDFTNDLEEVVKLLNSCLSSTRTTEEFLWKHYENPFGKSLGMVACEKEKLVGVRMFLKWQLRMDGKTYRAVRPVDTATAEGSRGKGIFSTLNRAGLENLKGSYDLIFNTPNNQSAPGNLKLGWIPTSQEFRHKLAIPNYLGKLERFKLIAADEVKEAQNGSGKGECVTNGTHEFVKWRYSGKEYRIAKFKNGVLIYRTLLMKGIKTLILLDHFGIHENQLKNNVRSLCRREKAVLVYYLKTKTAGPDFFLSLRRHSQLVLTRDDNFNLSKKLSFSLGDLEAKI